MMGYDNYAIYDTYELFKALNDKLKFPTDADDYDIDGP